MRTGVPEILKVHLLRFPTFCSAHRSPIFFALDLLDLPGYISLAWVYKSRVGLQDKRPKGRHAPDIEFSAHKKCDYGSVGPVQGRDRPSARVTSAWVS